MKTWKWKEEIVLVCSFDNEKTKLPNDILPIVNTNNEKKRKLAF